MHRAGLQRGATRRASRCCRARMARATLLLFLPLCRLRNASRTSPTTVLLRAAHCTAYHSPSPLRQHTPLPSPASTTHLPPPTCPHLSGSTSSTGSCDVLLARVGRSVYSPSLPPQQYTVGPVIAFCCRRYRIRRGVPYDCPAVAFRAQTCAYVLTLPFVTLPGAYDAA